MLGFIQKQLKDGVSDNTNPLSSQNSQPLYERNGEKKRFDLRGILRQTKSDTIRHNNSSNQFRIELEHSKLQDATRMAIEASWAEVERIQEDNQKLSHRCSELENQVKILQEAQRETQMRMELEKSSGDVNKEKNIGNSFPSQGDLSTEPSTFVQRRRKSLGANNSRNSILSESTVTGVPSRRSSFGLGTFFREGDYEKELLEQLSHVESERKIIVDDLEDKLKRKDQAIATLERTIEVQQETVQDLREQLLVLRSGEEKRNDKINNLESQFTQHFSSMESDRNKMIQELEDKFNKRDAASKELERTVEMQQQTIEKLEERLLNLNSEKKKEIDELNSKIHSLNRRSDQTEKETQKTISELTKWVQSKSDEVRYIALAIQSQKRSLAIITNGIIDSKGKDGEFDSNYSQRD